MEGGAGSQDHGGGGKGSEGEGGESEGEAMTYFLEKKLDELRRPQTAPDFNAALLELLDAIKNELAELRAEVERLKAQAESRIMDEMPYSGRAVK